MWFFYFLPMLVAIVFLLVRVSRGGSLTVSANWRQLSAGLFVVVVLGVLGAVLARALQ